MSASGGNKWCLFGKFLIKGIGKAGILFQCLVALYQGAGIAGEAVEIFRFDGGNENIKEFPPVAGAAAGDKAVFRRKNHTVKFPDEVAGFADRRSADKKFPLTGEVFADSEAFSGVADIDIGFQGEVLCAEPDEFACRGVAERAEQT